MNGYVLGRNFEGQSGSWNKPRRSEDVKYKLAICHEVLGGGVKYMDLLENSLALVAW